VRWLCAKGFCDRLGKEDSLVKLAFLPALIVTGIFVALTTVPAAAQYDPQAAAGGTLYAPVANPGSAPPGTSLPMGQEPSAMDSGLWEGASVVPGCSACGGGSGCPTSWYTSQGVRILSRSNLRKLPISFQAPAIPQTPGLNDSGYRAVLNSDGSGTFHVVNNDVTTDQSTFSQQGLRNANEFQVLNAKQLGLGIAPGYDMTIGHYLFRDKNNNDHFVEFSFWGLNSWSASRVLDGYLLPIYDEDKIYTSEEASAINNGTLVPTQAVPQRLIGSLRTGFPTPRELPGGTDAQKTLSVAFNNATEQIFSYRSTMNNFELNGRLTPRGGPDRLVMEPDGRWRRLCQPGTYMSYLYGLRFMQLDETFAFHSAGQGQWGEVWTAPTQNAEGDYDIVAHNSLLGLQIGADMTFRKCRWSWGIESKLGPYVNFANQISTINASVVNGTPQAAYDQRLVKNRYVAAMIGEVGFEANYKFRPNLVGRAAYDFMWITGLALAPEQLQLVAEPTNRINTNGTIFSHGVSLGMEWLW
jgi:hypothetical protein